MFDRLEDTLVRFEELLSMAEQSPMWQMIETFQKLMKRAGRFGSHRRNIQRI